MLVHNEDMWTCLFPSSFCEAYLWLSTDFPTELLGLIMTRRECSPVMLPSLCMYVERQLEPRWTTQSSRRSGYSLRVGLTSVFWSSGRMWLEVAHILPQAVTLDGLTEVLAGLDPVGRLTSRSIDSNAPTLLGEGENNRKEQRQAPPFF